MMSTQNLLIIGQGDIGLPVTNKLAQDSLNVTGLARRERHHYDLHPKDMFLFFFKQKTAYELS